MTTNILDNKFALSAFGCHGASREKQLFWTIFLYAEKKKAYTTTTERKSFGELFSPQRKHFQAGGGYKNPLKKQERHIYHRNTSSVVPSFW